MKDIRKNRLDVIEVMYIFIVIIISLVSFSLLHISSKTNREFSKNMVTARLLSQEGVKTIINLKNQNNASIIVGPQSYTWSELFSGALTFPPCTNPSDLTISCSDFNLKKCNTTNPDLEYSCIEMDTKPHTDVSWKILDEEQGIFSKKIRISDAGKNAKNITVFVWWVDAKGLHTSPITYKLMKGQK